MRDLDSILHRIDGRGYKAYKEIQGRCFSFDGFNLVVEQIEDPSQLRTIGWILGRLSERHEQQCEPLPAIRLMLDRLDQGDWQWLSGRPDGDLAAPRAHEVMAALNRLRSARFKASD